MIILMSAVLPLCAVEVTVSGIGAGDLAVARETALADALRNAVRQGAGVNIVSESKVKISSWNTTGSFLIPSDM